MVMGMDRFTQAIRPGLPPNSLHVSKVTCFEKGYIIANDNFDVQSSRARSNAVRGEV